MKEFLKNYSAGIAKGLGTVTVAAVLPLLLLRIHRIRQWAIDRDAGLSQTGRICLTIFLIGLSLVLLALLIRNQFSWKRKYDGFRTRVARNEVTEQEKQVILTELVWKDFVAKHSWRKRP